MIICGIKLTHDGAIALIDNGKLVFSYEMEKLDNNPRHAGFCITMTRVEEILEEYGYRFGDIDQLVIDGWDAWDAANIAAGAPRATHSLGIPLDGKREITIRELAGYGHLVGEADDILAACSFRVDEHNLAYKSYQHVSSHVLGAYCTSPFARNREDSFVLVWDGGMPPQLFYYRCRENEVRNLGPLFLLNGYLYTGPVPGNMGPAQRDGGAAGEKHRPRRDDDRGIH
jgi:carbamoyltransferase